MFRYYQTGETSDWTPIQDGKDVLDRAKKLGAVKLTILAVSDVVDDSVDKHNLAYKGPLYFDLDYKDDIPQAIASAKQLADRLKLLGVPEQAIQVVASGGKGLHLFVPAELFSSGRAVKNLPLIYKEMALELHVLGMDFQVYSQGRGVSWRMLNVQRADGNYPVPLTLAELDSLTEEGYREIVKAPRPAVVYDCKGVTAVGLEEMYERAKKKVRAKPTSTMAVASEELIKIRDVTPNCIEALVAYKVKGDVQYNPAALQLGIYAARAGVSQEVSDALCSRLAENAASSKYNTKRLRYEHAVGMVRYCQSNQSKTFSCNAMRGVLANRVCEGCPIYKQETADDDAGLELGIVEKEDGYYLRGEKTDRRISTFVLQPVKVHLLEPQGGGCPVRVSTVMDITRNQERIGTITFDESSWNSKAGFVRELEGIGNLSFVGTDTDVQRIKHTVYEEGREMGEVTQVLAAGIHVHKVGRRQVRVYVEPSYSFNQLQVQGTHQLGRSIPAAPHLKDIVIPDEGDADLKQALTDLLHVNSADIVAQILGWCCACHLKVHFMQRFSQFPLLSLWGNAGAGKTKTATLFAWLNGCDYNLEDAPVNLSSITTWALLSYCSSTTTVPRLLDEFNKAKMRRTYDMCGEVMKAGWNGQVIARGTPSSKRGVGPEVLETPITGPMLIMSEQAPEMPALQQRMVQVMLTRHGREGCEDRYEAAVSQRRQLLKIAKAMVGVALRTNEAWLEERMNSYRDLMPKEIDERPRYSYQVIMVGIDFFQKTCEAVGLDLGEEVKRLKAALLDTLKTQGREITLAKSRTEVDAVMEDVASMIALSDDGSETWLTRFKHFSVDADGDYLYLDLPIVHLMYKRYQKHQRGVVIIESASQFAKLLAQEPYFVSATEVRNDMVLGRPVVKLDIQKMANKGHLVSMFTG